MSQAKPYPLRMPEEMRELLQSKADAAGRSLNAEIVMRLQFSIEHDDESDDHVEIRMKPLDRRVSMVSQHNIIAALDEMERLMGGVKKTLEDAIDDLSDIEQKS